MATQAYATPMDTTETIGNSIIQHGPYNDRVYLMKLAESDFPAIIEHIERLAAGKRYSKIFVKAPRFAKDNFERAGYRTEACAPTFYRGEEPAYFMSRFLSAEREKTSDESRRAEVLQVCDRINPLEPASSQAADAYTIDLCTPADAEDMAALYRTVFDSYPFPIFDPEYLRASMAKHVVFFCARTEGRLAALSSAEIDSDARVAEVTDFATLPAHRGKGLATALLARMEQELRQRKIDASYTIARAASFGMNTVFAKHEYCYGGTLINNTNIGGAIESMNVWHKKL